MAAKRQQNDSMATHHTTQVIVKNLPSTWTVHDLRTFLEVAASLKVVDFGVQMFEDINHTALLTLQEPLSAESFGHADQALKQETFEGRVLELEAATSTTCVVLVHCSYPCPSRRRVLSHFDDLAHRKKGRVERCELYRNVLLAVVHFSSADVVETVVFKGNDVAQWVEPWCEQFHRPLLLQLLTEEEPRRTTAPETSHLTVSAEANPKVPTQANLADGHARRAPRLPSFAGSDGSRLFDLEMDQLSRELQQLQTEHEEVAPEEVEDLRMNAHSDAPKRKEAGDENENPKKFRGKTVLRLPVPWHKLRLLMDVAARWDGCEVTLIEKREEALFYGTEESCKQARWQFQRRVWDLAEDCLAVSDRIVQILETAKGTRYLDAMKQKHTRCSITVFNSRVVCVALTEEDLKSCKREFDKNFSKETFKVPLCMATLPEFWTLKLALENEYLVMLALPRDDRDDVQLEGLSGDVALAAVMVRTFISENWLDSQLFLVPGALTGRAVTKWFSRELDEVKELIKEKGKIEMESTEGEYTLRFYCRRQVPRDIVDKLIAIKDSIGNVAIDLNGAFAVYSDRALVINGLHNMGVGSFCSQLGQRLRAFGIDSIAHFTLPEARPLPPPRLTQEGRLDPSGGEDHYHQMFPASFQSAFIISDHGHLLQQPSGRSSMHHGAHHHHIYRGIVGKTTVSVKCGDITKEQVDVAVCVVGEDLSLDLTAVGSAFLKKCPSLEQELRSNSQTGVDTKGCRLITTAVGGSALPMSSLFYAVLSNTPQHAVSKTVKTLVYQSLQLAAQNGLTSIAFPPLGVGRRFDFDQITVAEAMSRAFQKYAQKNSNTMKRISVVGLDLTLANMFAEVFQRCLGRQPDAMDSQEDAAATTSSQRVTSEWDTHDDCQDRSEETRRLQVTDYQKVIVDTALQELRTTFLWQEALCDGIEETLPNLGAHVIEEISKSAVKNSVYLHMSEEGLRLTGQRDKVSVLMDEILSRLKFRAAAQQRTGSKLQLPFNTDRLPSYWQVCRDAEGRTMPYGQAIERWQKRGVLLNSVTAQEREAVEKLMYATWDAGKTRVGKDAQTPRVVNIRVTRVERLENPKLWQQYSQSRERLFRDLELRHRGASPACCTPVESLPKSSGPVLTAANIAKGSVLNRDIYPQVNEHYLFHGTKWKAVTKIYSLGLDFRVANEHALLGRGVYTAECPSKSDQYTDRGHAGNSDDERTMILTRVLLGEPYLHSSPHSTSFQRPPCMKCLQRNCSCTTSDELFNSVIADARLFREFVVFDQNVCYPEYFIRYKKM